MRIPAENSLVSNQKSSGRCWLFATCNVIRNAMAAKYSLVDFELSQVSCSHRPWASVIVHELTLALHQSYLFFYDSLSKGESAP